MANGAAREAEGCFRKALGLVPGLAEAHTNLGLLLDQQGRSDEAERHYRQAIALGPESGTPHLNLGVLLAGQKRFPEAEAAYRRALELAPGSAVAWTDLGVLLACLKREAEAEQSYRTAMELDAGNRLAPFNLSYLLLRQGRFEEGWRCLEARSWYDGLELQLPGRRWRGEPLNGRSLLIPPEGGQGDMIQFCRYAPLLKRRGAARITLICHPALRSLLATLDGVDAVLPFDVPLDSLEYDFWIPPLSLPLYCGTRLDTIPAAIPYLQAEPGRAAGWGSFLSRECAPSDLRVGLAWKGNPGFENDDQRSLAGLGALAPLGSVAGVRFFSLQKGAGEGEAATPPVGFPLVNLAPKLWDFADTAAMVANLDLVICVDTAVAHLSGALGKECWVLLPHYKTDWRWLTEREDSPWYPGVMRLFRQPGMGQWGAVIDEVRSALERLARGRSQTGDARQGGVK